MSENHTPEPATPSPVEIVCPECRGRGYYVEYPPGSRRGVKIGCFGCDGGGYVLAEPGDGVPA